MRNVVAIALAALLGCKATPPAPARTPPAPVLAVPEPAELTAPSAPLDDSPIYDLEVPLLDQSGRTIELATHRGHRVLIAMFYGSCPAACPRLIEDVRAIEEAVAADHRPDVRVLLVSFDPERDRPDKLADLARVRQLDPARWTLAAASEADARLLAAVLGIRYRKLDNGEFFHNSVVTVLDRDGRPVARLDGFGGDTAALAALVP